MAQPLVYISNVFIFWYFLKVFQKFVFCNRKYFTSIFLLNLSLSLAQIFYFLYGNSNLEHIIKHHVLWCFSVSYRRNSSNSSLPKVFTFFFNMSIYNKYITGSSFIIQVSWKFNFFVLLVIRTAQKRKFQEQI